MSQAYQLTGTVKAIGETQSFASGFTKRQFVVTTDDDKYPQDIALEVAKDKCALLDAYRVGDPITVDFNLRGNEYNGKYYVQLAAWKLDRQGSGQQRQAPPQAQPRPQQTQAQTPAEDYQEDDEIPF